MKRLLLYQQHYNVDLGMYYSQHCETFQLGSTAKVRCHYPWCGHQTARQPALPMWSGRAGGMATIKRCFWDCGTHSGGHEQLAAMCHDLVSKYDWDKAVRGAVGKPYTHYIKSRCVMCTDVAEPPNNCPDAVVWFVVQWTRDVMSGGERST